MVDISTYPKVSVVIPCYNRDLYIEETIKSVLAQTYPNIELITVDDGSTDDTRSILERFGEDVIILEHSGRVNKGQSTAINLGFLKVTGKYVAILDSDDLWAPEKIEKQVEFLESNPDIGLVYGNGYAINEKGEQLYQVYEHDPVEKSDPSRVLMDCYFLVPNNALVRREVYQQTGGFDESLRAAQDHDMAIRIAEVTKLAYQDEIVFYYRRHPDSISQTKADLRWKNGFLILNKARKRYPYSWRVICKRRAVLHFRLGQCYLESKNGIKALFHILLAGLLDPFRSIRVLLGRETITGPH